MGNEDQGEERFTLRLGPGLARGLGAVEAALRRSLQGAGDRTMACRVLLAAAFRRASETGELRAGDVTIKLDGPERDAIAAALAKE